MADNTAGIVAIELLAAAQGVDLRAPHGTSPRLREVVREVRALVPHYDLDRWFAPDIEAVTGLVRRGGFSRHCPLRFPSQGAPAR
jgi:histidine ammonia-lyase